MLNLKKSQTAFQEAKSLMPGGVNSPVRSYKSMKTTPPFIKCAKGSKIYDIDGNEYIDYVGSWGPMVLGHAHAEVIQALHEQILQGTSYGAPTLLETELAKLVQKFYPSIEVIRMVNSGTESTMSAIRLARGYTKRNKIVKFIGCYHGHSDSLLVKAGSGLATFAVPDSPGVTQGTAKDTITIPYNDIDAVEQIFKNIGDEIAAVILEPVAGNMGLILPKKGFLEKLRQLTTHYESLLIFDEVMCGFRASIHGAQGLYNITPDITCLGKIIGGGLPVAAYGGKREILSLIAPEGPVYQAGTLSGNPLAMTAGIKTLTILGTQDAQGKYTIFEKIEERTKSLAEGIKKIATDLEIPLIIHHIGSMLGIFFSKKDVLNYEDATHANQEAFRIWFCAMLEEKIYLAPSQFETIFVSLAHSDEDEEKTLLAAKKALQKVKSLEKQKLY